MLCINPDCGAFLTPGVDICPSCNWQQRLVSGPLPVSVQPITPTQPSTSPAQTPLFNPRQTVYPPPQPASPTPTPPNMDITLDGLIGQYPIANQKGPLSFLYRMRCPFCNFEFHPSDCTIVWLNEQSQYVQIHAAPVDNIQRFFMHFHTRTLDGEYARRDARLVCPQCNEHLPHNFERDPRFTIAVIGDTASGKSHYIATLLHLLNNRAMVQQGSLSVRFEARTEATRRQFQAYERKVFREHKTLPGTSEYVPNIGKTFFQWEPLIFLLRIEYTVNGQYKDNRIQLIFYDIAGEDIKKDSTQFKTWPISQANGIIYVVDPLSMSELRRRLQNNRQPNDVRTLPPQGGNAADLLADVMSSFMEINRGNPQTAIDTPVAIMLSKSDILDEIVPQIGLQSALFLQPAIYNGTVDMNTVNQIDGEVQYLLSALAERDILNAKQRFQRAKYFATSAIGSDPDPAQGTFPLMKPRRCLDPLLWLLWELSGTKR